MPKDWDEVKGQIWSLYKIQNKTLLDVQQYMRDNHQFHASTRSYNNHLELWGYHKNKTRQAKKRGVRQKEAIPRTAVNNSPQSMVDSSILWNSFLPSSLGNSSNLDSISHLRPLEPSPEDPSSSSTNGSYSVHSTSLLRSPLANGPTSPSVPESSAFDSQDHEGKTRLHHAVIRGELNEVQNLLSCQVQIDTQDDQGNRPLHYAAAGAYHGIIELLLRSCADVNARGALGRTPIHMAVRFPKAVRALLKAHPCLSTQDDQGDTALHLAISSSAIKISSRGTVVEKLIESGADVNITNNYGTTPFHMAVDLLHNERDHGNPYVTLFLQNNANLSLSNKDDELPFTVFLNRSILHCIRGCTQETCHQIKSFKLFLSKGADPNTRLRCGELLIHKFFQEIRWRMWCTDELLELLCEYADIQTVASNGDSPLHGSIRCSKCRFSKTFEILLRRGCDPNQENRAGETPLIVLFKSKWTDMDELFKVTNILLDSGAESMHEDSAGNTPIYQAWREWKDRSMTLIRILIDSFVQNGQDVNLSLYTQASRWWCEYMNLWRQQRWSTNTKHLVQCEDMPIDVAEELPRRLLLLVTGDILTAAKRRFIDFREALGIGDEKTQTERDHIVSILRDCYSMNLDIEVTWYHFLLKLFD
ncbi:hypothetical protein MMC12_008680 [Toensbergia leucococca]|nr:hypothetical protein [Toensbergia leucococca]